ncbi:MAG TPA: pitrilysin family protein [Bryobacteraceae bacterium]|nr:pitrilysin family protein [Bryobacteraceae bacterium]
MRKTLLCLIPVGLWMAWAQAPQMPMPGGGAPPKKEAKDPFKNKAPVSKELLKVKLPKPEEFHLDNGLTVMILEDHRLPQITMSFGIRGSGGLDEPADMSGLATVTATMLREGTTTRSSKQIADESDRLAAGIGASSGFGATETNFTMSGLTDNFDKWFALGVDVMLHPSFPADEWGKLKQRQLLGLRQNRTSAQFLAQEQFSRAVFGSHPAARIASSPESLGAITIEAMKKWHDERYVPQNTLLGVVGDVTPAQLLPKLKEAFASWKKTDLQPAMPGNPALTEQARVLLVNRPNSVQTNLLMGNLAIDRRSPDYVTFVVMNEILGAGPTARLFNNLREDKGYTYGAYSSFAAQTYPGPWRASSEVRTDVTEGAMKEFFNEFKRMRDEKIPAAELEEKKRSVVARFALSLESPQQLLVYAHERKFYGLPDDYWDTYPAKISAVTADDVQRVAKKYLNLDDIQIVAVGDGSKIKSVMEKYGKVTVYDTDGKVMP